MCGSGLTVQTCTRGRSNYASERTPRHPGRDRSRWTFRLTLSLSKNARADCATLSLSTNAKTSMPKQNPLGFSNGARANSANECSPRPPDKTAAAVGPLENRTRFLAQPPTVARCYRLPRRPPPPWSSRSCTFSKTYVSAPAQAAAHRSFLPSSVAAAARAGMDRPLRVRCGKVRRSPAVQTIGRLALRAFVPAVRHRTADHSGNDPTTALLLPLTHPFLQSSGLAAHKPQLHLDVRPPVPRTVPSTLPPSETSKDERRRAPGSRRRSAVGLRSRPARVASSLLVFGHVLLAALRQHRSRHRDLCWRRPRPPHDNTREGIDCIRGPADI